MKGVLVMVSFCFFANTLFAQKNTSYNNQQWVQYYNTIKFSDKFLLKTDGGYRKKNDFKNASQYIVRLGVGYKIMPHMQVAAGFAHLGYYDNNDNINKLEYRPYQELLINDKYNFFKIQHRFRIEQRFFNDEFRNYFFHRFRYRILFKIPIADFSQKRKGSKLYLNLSDELFIHAGEEIVYNVFGKNRAMIGTTFRLNNAIDFTLTYNSEFSSSNVSNKYSHTNVVWLGIKHTINVFDKKYH